MVRCATVRISRPVRPACCAEASRRTPTSRPGLGRSANRRPADGGGAGRRRGQPDHDPHGGGLAGAVGAEEAGDPAGLGGEGDVVDGGEPAVRLGEGLDFDHGLTLSCGNGYAHRGRPRRQTGADPEKFSGSYPERMAHHDRRETYLARRPSDCCRAAWALVAAAGRRLGMAADQPPGRARSASSTTTWRAGSRGSGRRLTDAAEVGTYLGETIVGGIVVALAGLVFAIWKRRGCRSCSSRLSRSASAASTGWAPTSTRASGRR